MLLKKTDPILVVAAVFALFVLDSTCAFSPPRPSGDGFYYSGGLSSDSALNLTNYTTQFTKVLEDHGPPDTELRLNHYTFIGMPSASIGGMMEQAKAVFDDSENIRVVEVTDDCSYVLYQCKSSGAQLWGEAVRPNDKTKKHFGGFVPHFHGKSKVKMCILTTEPVPFVFDDGSTAEHDIALCGSFMATMDPNPARSGLMEFLVEESAEQGGVAFHKMLVNLPNEGFTAAGLGVTNPDTKEGFLAFDFDCPNYGFFSRMKPSLPTHFTVQLAAFAREVSTYDSVEDYYAESKDAQSIEIPDKHKDKISKSGLASKFFGAGNLRRDENNEEKTCAMFVGHVVETEVKINELTGKPFYWALIRTSGDMEMDVVIHPALIELGGAKPPRVGGVIEGYGWLSGMLLLEDEVETENGSE